MAYVIIAAEKKNSAKLNEFMADEFVSRQSITIKDGATLGMKEGYQYALIEGDDAAITKVKALVKEKSAGDVIAAKDAEAIYTKIKEEEENAASGVGLIFG